MSGLAHAPRARSALMLFVEDFDHVPERASPPPQLPPEPEPVAEVVAQPELLYSQADLDEACAVAIGECRLAREQEVAANLEAIRLALEDARGEALRATEAVAERACAIVLESLRALLPEVMERFADAGINRLLDELGQALKTAPSVRVRLAEADFDRTGDALARLCATRFEDVAVAPDAALAPGALRVEWQGGVLRHAPDAVLRELDRILRLNDKE